MKYFIDFDGVLADLDWAARQWIHEKFGRTLTSYAHNQWSFNEAYGFPRTLNAEFWTYVWRHHGRLYDGATRVLSSIRGEVRVFSTRPLGDPRDNFDRKFRLRIQPLVAGIHLFDSWAQKEKFILLERPDVVLEDNLEFLLKMPKTDTRLFLLDRPWNQSADLSDHYTRVMDYGEFLERTRTQ